MKSVIYTEVRPKSWNKPSTKTQIQSFRLSTWRNHTPPCGFWAAVGVQCKHMKTNGTTRLCAIIVQSHRGAHLEHSSISNVQGNSLFKRLWCTDVKRWHKIDFAVVSNAKCYLFPVWWIQNGWICIWSKVCMFVFFPQPDAFFLKL